MSKAGFRTPVRSKTAERAVDEIVVGMEGPSKIVSTVRPSSALCENLHSQSADWNGSASASAGSAKSASRELRSHVA